MPDHLMQAIVRLCPDLVERINFERSIGASGQPPAPAGSALRPDLAALLPAIDRVPAEGRWEAAAALLEALRAGRCQQLVEIARGDAQAASKPFDAAVYTRLDPGCFIPERDIVRLDGKEVSVRVKWGEVAVRSPASRVRRREPLTVKRDEFIRDAVARGEIPPDSMPWGEFTKALIKHCDAKGTEYGFKSREHLSRLVKKEIERRRHL